MRGTARFALAIVAVSAIVALSACSCVAQKALEGATGVKVDQNGKSVPVQGPNGQNVPVGGDNGKLPDGFPTDVPIYSPATVTNSVALASDKGTIFNVELETADSASSVASWYATQVKDKGWSIQANANSADGGSLITSEKPGKSLSVVVNRGSGGGKTTVSLSYAPK